MNDAELRSLERLCSKDDLSDGNVATLTLLGLRAATEIRRRRANGDGLGALGFNLAIAAALTRAFRLGDRFGFDMGSDSEQRTRHEWSPNTRGRVAGSACDDPACSCREGHDR